MSEEEIFKLKEAANEYSQTGNLPGVKVYDIAKKAAFIAGAKYGYERCMCALLNRHLEQLKETQEPTSHRLGYAPDQL